MPTMRRSVRSSPRSSQASRSTTGTLSGIRTAEASLLLLVSARSFSSLLTAIARMFDYSQTRWLKDEQVYEKDDGC